MSGLFDVEGKTVVVTGGTRGIGLMIAKGFAEAGARVIISSRKADACESAAAELSAFGDVVAHPADLSTPEGVADLAAFVTRTFDRVDVLVTLIEAYEAKHHPIPAPDPIAAIEFMMEQKGLTRRDLEPAIGSRGRVSEVLTRKRPLTLPMVRALSALLDIPTDVLVQPYETRSAA